MAKYLVVSTSGNPDSNSRRMGRIAFRHLEKAKVPCEWLDISELELPLCDADACYAKPGSQTVGKSIKAADGILLATPVYNYDVSAAAKNLVELTGSAWEDKVVGFLCAAGGMSSYMSVMAFANSLMLDFRSVIIPRFVYATGGAFEGGDLKDKEVGERIVELTNELIRFTEGLKGAK
jgi:FMN reductase